MTEKHEKRYARAIIGLLEKPTVSEAARYAEVSETTLYRWMNDTGFQMLYRAARRDIVKQAVARLQRACSRAVDTLQDVMEDSESSASARVTAAKTVMEMAFKAVELEDLEERVTALEGLGDLAARVDVQDVPELSHYTTEELSQIRAIHETADARRDSARG